MNRNVSLLAFTLLGLATASPPARSEVTSTPASNWVVDTATLPPTIAPTDDSISLIRGIATLRSDTERTIQLWFSYSDGLAIHLNRQRLFVGRNDSDSRFPNYLGIVGDEVEAVDLPLRAGDNELMLAITDKAFGWGFRARLSSRDGVQVMP